jgi:hypothetical protein
LADVTVATAARFVLGRCMVSLIKRPTEAWCSADLFKNGFGQDGKPLFVQSSNDSPEFVHHVMTTLTQRLGTDGFHYILEAGSLPDELG